MCFTSNLIMTLIFHRMLALTALLCCLSLVTVDGMTIDEDLIHGANTAAMFDFYHVMPESDVKIMTELDLLLTLQQYRELHTPQHRVKRKGVRNITKLWPERKVYYEIDTSLSADQDTRVIEDAIQEWQTFTCLTFEKSTKIPNRIQFKDGSGCYSQLGMQSQPQPISLARGCRNKWTVVHEIGHAIGWYHEHMRPDRDDYIRINFDVIPMRFKENFKKYAAYDVNTHDVEYDYESVMHYGSTALPGSITTLDPNYQHKIGQRNGFTFKDIKLANLMYNCSGVSKCEQKECPKNGFVFYKSYNGVSKCECWCDSGSISHPLTPCETSKERPSPVPISPPTPPPDNACYDVRKDCPDMKARGKCMSEMDLMMDLCAKTCKFCGRGRHLCMDHEKGCRIMAATGMCDRLVDLMKTLCPASCDLCDKVPDPCEIQHEMMGTNTAHILSVSFIMYSLMLYLSSRISAIM